MPNAILITRDLDAKVTEHFKWREFFVSGQFPEHQKETQESFIRGDISDSVLLRVWAACVWLLQPLRVNLGPVIITSGYRSKALNDVILGANPTSWHLFEGNYGAVDFYVKDEPIRLVAEWLKRNTQFERIVVYDTFIHLNFLTGFDNQIKAVYID